MSLDTDAAVAKINVNSSVLKSDPVLTLLLTVLPSHQVEVSITTPAAKSNAKGNKGKGGGGGGGGGGKKGKKGKGNAEKEAPASQSSSPAAPSAPLSLTTNGGNTVLTQRNAILRCVCGMTLHNQLDSRPPYLLGGYSAPSADSPSPEASFVTAGISSWMSVAGTLREKSGDGAYVRETCGGLDGVLEGRAFLCGETVAQPTIADLDVFFALAGALAGMEDADDVFAKSPNLQRWMRQCAASVGQMAQANSTLPNLPAVEVPDIPALQQPHAAPVFVYDADTAAIPLEASKPAASPTQTDKSSKPPASAPAPASGEITDEQKKIANEKRAAKKAAKDAKRKEAEAAKGNDKSAKNKQKSTPAAELTIAALDIRIGKILSAENHETSEKLYVEMVDVGEDKPRQILSGLRKHYTLEEMRTQGYVLVLCNLKSRKIADLPSHGMVLCASNADHTAVEFVVPPLGEGVEPKVGERVMFEGHAGDPEPENKVAKKKMFEKLAPDFKTNADGVVSWKGALSTTTNGPCVAIKGMKDANVA